MPKQREKFEICDAIDPELFKNFLFNGHSAHNTKESDDDEPEDATHIKRSYEAYKERIRKHRRKRTEPEDSRTSSRTNQPKTESCFSLPDFLSFSKGQKNFIAKKLDEYLTKQIKFVEKTQPHEDEAESSDKDSKCEIFTNVYETPEAEFTDVPVHRKHKKRKLKNYEKVNEADLSSIVVDASWVLQKKGVYD